MRKQPDPDEVDLFVGDVSPDANAARETTRFISEYKARPDYPAEIQEAERILASLNIRPSDFGMPDAESLLAHQRSCVADLTKPAAHISKTERTGPSRS